MCYCVRAQGPGLGVQPQTPDLGNVRRQCPCMSHTTVVPSGLHSIHCFLPSIPTHPKVPPADSKPDKVCEPRVCAAISAPCAALSSFQNAFPFISAWQSSVYPSRLPLATPPVTASAQLSAHPLLSWTLSWLEEIVKTLSVCVPGDRDSWELSLHSPCSQYSDVGNRASQWMNEKAEEFGRATVATLGRQS